MLAFANPQVFIPAHVNIKLKRRERKQSERRLGRSMKRRKVGRAWKKESQRPSCAVCWKANHDAEFLIQSRKPPIRKLKFLWRPITKNVDALSSNCKFSGICTVTLLYLQSCIGWRHLKPTASQEPTPLQTKTSNKRYTYHIAQT